MNIASMRNGVTPACPTNQSAWKTAGTMVRSLAIGAFIIGAIALGAQWSTSTESLNTKSVVPDMLSHLKKVANTTVDVCKDTFFHDKLCKGNLGIPRNQMPQVEGDVLQNYLDYQTSQNITVQTGSVNPKELIATQNEMHAGKILTLAVGTLNKEFNACNQPILVAKNQIVDGHHRFGACSILGKDQKAITIDKDILTILQELRNFPGVKVYNL